MNRRGVLTSGVMALALVLTAAGAAASPKYLKDPKHDAVPSSPFRTSCGTQAALGCDAAALRDFDKARAREGLAPMSLPRGFDRLPIAQQLFVLANIERVDRGQFPILALSGRLNHLAKAGAKVDADPAFGHGTAVGSNWSRDGETVLYDDFSWVYADGHGGSNFECTSQGRNCWIHRHNILGVHLGTIGGRPVRYTKPLLMGAAVAYGTAQGTSMTETFAGGDRTESPAKPHWSHFAAKFPLGVARHHFAVAVGRTGKLRLWASGATMKVTIAFPAGSGHWTVPTRHYTIKAGHSRNLRLTHRSSGDGVLRLKTAHDTERVTLADG